MSDIFSDQCKKLKPFQSKNFMSNRMKSFFRIFCKGNFQNSFLTVKTIFSGEKFLKV